MKRRIVALLIMLCMACSITACGASVGEQAARVVIDGKEYDLSGDIQDVIGMMVKDGVTVIDYYLGSRKYDEEGKLGDKYSLISEPYHVAVGEREQWFRGKGSDEYEEYIEKYGHFIRKDYYFVTMEEKDIVSGLGVPSKKDIDKVLIDKKFLETERVMNVRYDEGYVAVLVNGKVLELSEYEEKLEELKDDDSWAEEGISITRRYFPHMSAVGVSSLAAYDNSSTYKMLKKTVSNTGMSLDDELLINFAVEDACEQLEDGKIESFAYVGFGVAEEPDRVDMIYSEFYLDKDYDSRKFYKE